jgi:chromosome segregation ATPase
LIYEAASRAALEKEVSMKEDYLMALNALKENFATLKSRNDDLALANINLTNEKSRVKGEIELMRQSGQMLHKQLSEVTARYEELKKNFELNFTEKADLNRAHQLLQAANTELVGQNHSLSAKYDESLKAIAEQKLFIAEAQQALKTSFDSLSAAALDKNNQSFLDIAKN